jgi:3-oxoacyl-[acyl-carrier-protein] synthase I
MNHAPLSIAAVGAVTSVGFSALECWLSVRAGITRFAETSIVSRARSPLRMALVPEGAGGVLPLVDAALRAPRHRRMLRLATSVIAETAWFLQGRALPITLVTSGIEGDHSPMLHDLAMLNDGRVDLATSRHLTVGAAGLGIALADAAHRIRTQETSAVVIVTVDSLFDLRRLDALQQSGRVLTEEATDAMIPGEGAAAIVVCSDEYANALAHITGHSTERDSFTRDGELPLTGDGLTTAIRGACQDAHERVGDVWTAVNGESWTAREWGIAARRNQGALHEAHRVHHPAEYWGDTGAAHGGLMLSLAAVGLSRATAPRPVLVCAYGEEGYRCAVRLARPVA